MGVVARIALIAVLAVPFFWGLGEEELHGDEVHWLSSGRQAFWLVTSGRLDDAQWREEFYFYSQPQVGKLLIGAAQWVAGYRGPAQVVDYDWQLLPEQNRVVGRMPEEGALLAGRVPGAAMGWLGCLLLWGLAALLGLRGVGPVAAVLLASHPLWLANARRAGLDVPALTLGMAAVAAIGLAVRAWQRQTPVGASGRSVGASGARVAVGVAAGALGWWAAAGVLLGLAVGTKYVALLAFAGAAGFVCWSRRWVAGAALAGVVGVVTFVGSNPALYSDPWGQLNVSLGFLAYQAEGMRHTIPEFRSPVWVAAEIFDRMVWPVGGPRVVERSMLEPLIPGTYGTPVVTLGAAVALMAAVTTRRRGLVAVVVWTAAVYAALAVSLPTWWERWHLPLVLPLTLLGACGLAALPASAAARAAVRESARVPGEVPARVPVLLTLDWRRWGLPVGWALAGAQMAGALALLPSYLNKGFGHLVMTPLGAFAHLAALAYALATLVSLALLSHRESRRGRGEKAPTWRAAKTTSAP